MSALLSVSEELLPIEQIKFYAQLGPRTLTAQVYRATIGSKDYAVKLVSASWRYTSFCSPNRNFSSFPTVQKA